jgi:hypothetical protein
MMDDAGNGVQRSRPVGLVLVLISGFFTVFPNPRAGASYCLPYGRSRRASSSERLEAVLEGPKWLLFDCMILAL